MANQVVSLKFPSFLNVSFGTRQECRAYSMHSATPVVDGCKERGRCIVRAMAASVDMLDESVFPFERCIARQTALEDPLRGSNKHEQIRLQVSITGSSTASSYHCGRPL